ncbi:MAG: EamA family transporter [Rhodocyclaceae bacterium]|nr:EamA family transporter [Rhodocyclaceae bacterium]
MVWSPAYVALVAAIGVLVTALGWALWSYVLKRLPAWQASLSVLGVPAMAVLGSRLQMGEQVDALEMAGIALIAAGLALLSLLGWLAERRMTPAARR